MKRLIILNLIIMNSFIVNAQGLSNIFNQKAADLKSVGKQIALLQLYIGWIEKGYSIARSGLTLIGDIKQGEFNLHSIFFGSLNSVNPSIRKYAKVASIVTTVQSISKGLSELGHIQNLNSDEKRYLVTVKENLSKECNGLLDQLLNVLTDDHFQMNDAERLENIDGIYVDVNRKWVLSKEFVEEAQMVSAFREKEQNNIGTLQNMR
jgi:hypothetical protein